VESQPKSREELDTKKLGAVSKDYGKLSVLWKQAKLGCG